MIVTAKQKLQIGIFTIIGFLLLIGGIFLIGSKKNMFGDTFTVYGTFRNVGGLQVGNNVRFVGINVGTVENIQIISDSMARVDLRLQSNVHPFIKKDAVASISSDGLMGDKLVTIAAGGANNNLLKAGEMIRTVDPLDFDKIITRVTHIADNAEMITTDLSGIVSKVNQGKGSIGRLLSSEELANNLEGTVKSANATISSVKKSSEGFSENMEAVHHNFLLRGFFKKKEKEKQKKLKEEQQKQEADKKKKEDAANKKPDAKDAPKPTAN